MTSASRGILLALEILLSCGEARRLIHSADLEQGLDRLRRRNRLLARHRSSAHVQRLTAISLGHAVMHVLARLLTDRRCLFRSLVLSVLLARRGIPGTFVLGVRPDVNVSFLAHAWVEVHGAAVIPDEGFLRLHQL